DEHMFACTSDKIPWKLQHFCYNVRVADKLRRAVRANAAATDSASQSRVPWQVRDTPPVPTTSRSPKLGYALAATAATLWALNGSLSRFLLDDHLPPARLAELRSVCTFAVLAIVLAAKRPALLHVRRSDLGRLALLGIVGFAGNTALYYA